MLSRDPATKKIQGVHCCDKKQLIYAFEQLEVHITPYDLEIIFEKLFDKCQNLSAIPIDSIFRIFSLDVYNTETKVAAVEQQPERHTINEKQSHKQQQHQQESLKQDSQKKKKNNISSGEEGIQKSRENLQNICFM